MVDVEEDALRATGTQIGIDPFAYRLDYELEVGGGFVTSRFHAQASGAGWSRRLDLRHRGDGVWECEAASGGGVALPPPGGDPATVAGALDCDLGLCPLTNVMPVLRHDLHRRPGEVDFVMAWVSVPDLGLHRSPQRYEHVGERDGRRIVRFVGEHGSFVGELELDDDGFVLFYPDLARRVGV